MISLQKALNLIPLGLMLLGSAVAIANIQGGNARHDDPAPASLDATREGYLIAVQLAARDTPGATLDTRSDARDDFAANSHP